MQIAFTLEDGKGVSRQERDFRGALICGYTGRDQAAVRQHIDELAREGIEPPPMVPMYFAKPAWGLSWGGEMQVQGAQTSGEIEAVLLVQGEEILLGAGSDHTDRELEKLDIAKSKLVYPSMIGDRFWRHSEIKDHWDQIELRSWAVKDGRKVLYQEATLAAFLSPEDLLAKVRAACSVELDQLAILCGTSPLLTEGFVYAERFEGELFDPVTGRRISLGYDVKVLDWFRA